jgi:hypothetical protein
MVTVNTELDSVDAGDGLTSLREAIATTNAMPGPDEISFDFGHDGPATILLTQGELNITDSLTINGPGANLLTIDASGSDPTPIERGDTSRIFHIYDGNELVDSPTTIHGLTLTGCDTSDAGGAILTQESLSVSSSTITGNSASSGGGIRTFGYSNLTVIGSTISGNRAAYGGGIHAHDLTVTRSTISGNMAGTVGGGIVAYTATISFSTISGNSTVGFTSGGIHASGGLTLISSTITGNSSTGGSGGVRSEGMVTIKNSIVAGNTAVRIPDLAHGNIENSLIGDNQDTTLAEAPVGMPDAKGNLIGGFVGGTIDPMLGPLTNNGGPTFTHAPLPGSPVINAGDPKAVAGVDGVPMHDQRGAPFARIIGGRIDMGAVESQPILPAMFGDFNFDGVVDTMDYVIWRSTLGDSLTSGSGADGSGNGLVDQADYQVWRSNFGRALPPASTAIASGASIEPLSEIAGATVRFSAGQFDESRSDGRPCKALERVITAQNHRRYLDLLLMLDAGRSSPLRTVALDAAFDDVQVVSVAAVSDVETSLVDGLEDNVS